MPSRQRDKQTTQTRVYKYGLVSKGYVPKEAIDELYKTNQLWNRLVDLHYKYWQELERARCAASPEYQSLFDAAKAIKGQIDEAYQESPKIENKTSSSKGNDPETETVNKCIKQLREKRDLKRKAMEALRPKLKELIDENALNKKRSDEFNKAVRVKQSGIMRDTANEVKNNFDTARERILKNPESGRLRSHPFDRTGYWHYRFDSVKPDGVSFEELFEEGKKRPKAFTFFYCVSDIRRKNSPSKPPKERLYLKAKLAGSRTNDSKIYHIFDVILHRPIPKGAQIQNAKILRTRTGDKFRYDLALTVKFPKKQEKTVPLDNAIGIDIGFRQDEGLADAKSDGESKLQILAISSLDDSLEGVINPEQFLPAKMMKAFDHIDALKNNMDDAATVLGDKLKPLFKKVPVVAGFDENISPPDDPVEKRHFHFIKLCASVLEMRSPVTLSFETAYKLAVEDHHHATILPEDIRSLIQDFWKHYRLSYLESHHLRAKQIRRRKDFYRNLAARLVNQGMLICIEEQFLAKIAMVKNKDKELAKRARTNRVRASLYTFISALKSAAEREAVPLVEVKTANTSKQCHICEEINKDLKGEKEWRCKSCGVAHDRDINAAKNIARIGLKTHKEKSNKTK